MIARTSWIAKLDKRFGDNSRRKDEAADLPIDDLLDARFDSEGRIEAGGRGNRQRAIERLDPRSPSLSAEDLERAVQKLAQGLQAIERQGGAPAAGKARASSAGRAPAEGDDASEPDFVTSSLDRLEARLEALSEKLKQRARNAPEATGDATSRRQVDQDANPASGAGATGPVQSAAVGAGRAVAPETQAEVRTRPDPSLAVEAASGHDGPSVSGDAEPREVEAAAQANQRAEFAAAEDEGSARAAEAARAEREALERDAESLGQAAAARLALAAEEHRRVELETRRLAEEAARMALESAEAAEAAGEVAHTARAQFAVLEARIAALQDGLGDTLMEPLRNELVELLRDVEDLQHDRKSVAGAVEQVRAKIDEVDTKFNAGRNLTGNRLSELQDRLAGLAERLGEMEVEVPGFDAVRENLSAILERFDQMEGIVNRMAPEQVLDKVDDLKRAVQAIAAQRESARIEQGILALADRLDALPGELADRPAQERLEARLQTFAAEFAEARRSGDSGRSEVKERLADLYAGLKDVAETGRTPDLSGLDERLAAITSQIAEERRFSGTALARLDERLAELTASVEKQESAAATEILARLSGRMDEIDEAIRAQDAAGARRDIGQLDGKLDQLHQALAEQAEHLSRPQVEPLEHRFDALQAQIAGVAERATASMAQFGPFAQKLQDIAERLNGLGGAESSPLANRLAAIEERIAGLCAKGPDPRAIHNQLDNIVSRLELLKGRSIDPVRLKELFDRVDIAMRGAASGGHLERIEQKLAEVAHLTAGRSQSQDQLERIERKLEEATLANPASHIQRLERQIAESGRTSATDDRLIRIEQKLSNRPGVSDERFAVLERKLDELARIYASGGEVMSQDDLTDLRGDIVALRRELRSLPGLGEGEGNLGEVLRTISAHLERLPDEAPASATELERQIDRIAQLLDDPTHSRLALAHIETSLKTLQENLDEARRAAVFRAGRDDLVDADGADGETVAELARSLSDDVGILRNATEATEKRTRDALEAVHGTLEAVVKRMAFLERDADKVAGGEERHAPQARGRGAAAPDALRMPRARESEDAFASQLPELAAPSTVAPAMLPIAAAADSADTSVARAELPRDAAAGGLFSRLTSSQLLKRATGGRTDSFSPDVDEAEDADLPLEPGTDSPLTSALTGAPSSDTERFSGARSKARQGAAKSGETDSRTRGSSAEPLAGDDDFLSAARRAAQAAAAEATEGERDGSGIGGSLARMFGRSKARGFVLAGALAVAAAFAAVQILRGQIGLSLPELAGFMTKGDAARPTDLNPAGPVGTTELDEQGPATVGSLQSAPWSDVAPVPAEPSPSVMPVAGPPPSPAPVTAAIPQTETAAPEPADEGETVAARADEPIAAEAQPASPPSAEPERTASLNPSTAVEADGVRQDDASAPAALMPPPPLPPGFPAAIGPDRLRSEAEAGNPIAAFEVAARYAEGRGVPANPAASVAWYTRAAQSGVAPAQYRLGSIYEKGMGLPKDLAAAQDWYRRAADVGNVKAMHNLAVLYAEGAGGAPDLEHAARLFRAAAEHGVRDSQFNLAILHARGLGVRQDMQEAFKWFAIAAGSGDAESLKRRDIIGAALTPGDRAKAEAAAAAFQPEPLVAEANDVAMPDGGWGEEVAIPAAQSENDLVALVQKLLADKGYDPGPADGLLGEKTIQAITQFQQAKGLSATGRVDTGLVAALQGQAT